MLDGMDAAGVSVDSSRVHGTKRIGFGRISGAVFDSLYWEKEGTRYSLHLHAPLLCCLGDGG